MPIFFNNCRCRDHVGYFGKNAFYDLNTTGMQAEMAPDLKPGEKCVVAAYDATGEVIFSWYSLSHVTREQDPDEPEMTVRGFRGKLIRSKRFSKAQASKTKPYSVFFNVLGHFKRPSVIKA